MAVSIVKGSAMPRKGINGDHETDITDKNQVKKQGALLCEAQIPDWNYRIFSRGCFPGSCCQSLFTVVPKQLLRKLNTIKFYFRPSSTVFGLR